MHGRAIGWGHFYLEQVAFSGVSPAAQSAVRLALAARLEGADFSLGPSGLLPGRFVETVESVFAARGLLPQLTAVEKDQILQVAIVLLPAAASRHLPYHSLHGAAGPQRDHGFFSPLGYIVGTRKRAGRTSTSTSARRSRRWRWTF